MTPGSASPLLLDAAGGYQISRSLRFRASASAYMNKTFASNGNRKTWTWSAWIKYYNPNTFNYFFFSGNDTSQTASTYFAFMYYLDKLYVYNNFAVTIVTSRVFRDPSAWHHLVVAFDTTQAVSTDRVKIYVNGVRETSFTQYDAPAQNTDYGINQSAWPHFLGSENARRFFDGYITEVNFIDGQQLDASAFGLIDTTTGVWTPKRYTGSYGTNGFYLNFSDNSAATAAAIGKDSSGNGNNFTPNNISLTAGATYDSMIDTPTPYDDGGNGRGNYPVANPLWKAEIGRAHV